ncbi:hypothetical protein R1flu_027105 [Riccia fluitans]|uniref:Uncharacterized protein n=1 Tax=Riccia fluitans TaxID=41844 RepID=A0ABD1XHV7_9MARC
MYNSRNGLLRGRMPSNSSVRVETAIVWSCVILVLSVIALLMNRRSLQRTSGFPQHIDLNLFAVFDPA